MSQNRKQREDVARWLDWDALERWVAENDPPAPADRTQGTRKGAAHVVVSVARHIADRSGYERSNACRWRNHGVPLYAADHVATAFGVHPVEIWPDFHDDLEGAA